MIPAIRVDDKRQMRAIEAILDGIKVLLAEIEVALDPAGNKDLVPRWAW